MGRRAYCDGHGEDRNDVRSVGRDANDEPDAPDFCFLCRKEAERGRFYDRKQGRYVPRYLSWHEVRAEVKASVEDYLSQVRLRVTKKQIRDVVEHDAGHMSPKLRREMVDDLWGILR